MPDTTTIEPKRILSSSNAAMGALAGCGDEAVNREHNQLCDASRSHDTVIRV